MQKTLIKIIASLVMSAAACIATYLAACFAMWDFIEVNPVAARLSFIGAFLGAMIAVKDE